MKNYLLSIILLVAISSALFGQDADSISVDTTIYSVLEQMPRFPACEKLDTTIEAKNACAQIALLSFMNQNIVYPVEARQKNASGMVVVKFVVEKDGSISSPKIMRDVEGGCGLEVLRVLNAMNNAQIKWVPGMLDAKPVRAYFTLPIRFRLEEAPPFTMIGNDSVWVEFDTPLEYEGGYTALSTYLNEKVKYPEALQDSCLIGKVEIKLLVDRRGKVRVLDLVDLNNLGFDFWYAATDAVTSTIGKWKVATYEGQKVPASYDISISFVPESSVCQNVVDQYNQAIELVNEGTALFGNDEQEAGIEKMSEALALFPDDAEFLLIRGQAYLDQNNFEAACTDLSRAKDIALIDWYDNILPIICKMKQEDPDEN